MQQYTLYQGEVFDEPVEFQHEDTTFDFARSTIESILRKDDVKGPIAHTFVITPNLRIGTADFRLQMSPEETAALKVGSYVGDIKYFRETPEYGPYIVAQYCIKVIKPSTRDE